MLGLQGLWAVTIPMPPLAPRKQATFCINSLDWTVGHEHLPEGGALTAREWHRGSFRFQEVFKTKELKPKPLLPWPLLLRNHPHLHLQATFGSIFILEMCSLGQLCFYLRFNFVFVSFFKGVLRYVSHLQSCFIFQTTLWAKSCCHPHFINGETEAESSLLLVRVCGLGHPTLLQTPQPAQRSMPPLHLGSSWSKGWGWLIPQDVEIQSTEIPGYGGPGMGWAGTSYGREEGCEKEHICQRRCKARSSLSQPRGNSRLNWLKGTVRNA